MSLQRQLNALLFELQSAPSPLEEAKAIARAWRTIRDLSPSDRRLLARQAGFEGAEQLLEGLASRGRGVGSAPSLLLQLLGELRHDDRNAVAELMGSLSEDGQLTDPSHADDGQRPQPEDGEVHGADGDAGDLPSVPRMSGVEGAGPGSPEETVAALEALRKAGEERLPGELAGKPTVLEVPVEDTPVDGVRGEISGAGVVGAPVGANAPPLPEKVPPLLEEWELLTESSDSLQRDVQPVDKPNVSPSAQLERNTDGVVGGAQATAPVLERFRRLKRQLDRIAVGNEAQRLQVVHGFPDGWQRRRVIVALLESGVVSSSSEGLDLVATLARQLDRRWCLRVLRETMDLGGVEAERAAQLVPARPGGRIRGQLRRSDTRDSPD